jgi:hypothetical protein
MVRRARQSASGVTVHDVTGILRLAAEDGGGERR